MGNITGHIFRVTTFGESHGTALGAVIDGCPPGLCIDLEALQGELDRRRPGQSSITTQRREADTVEIVSGMYEGKTTGTPLTLVFYNDDARSKDYRDTENIYRPGHADYTYEARFGHRDHRGGGRASARETVARVAAAGVAKQWLQNAYGIEVHAWVHSVGTIASHVDPKTVTREDIDLSIVRCPDPKASPKMEAAIEAAANDGDTLGGIVRGVARNLPAGFGAPVFDKIEADLAKACLSLPACKGFEVGSGFLGTTKMGSEHNDALFMGNGQVRFAKNDAGGTLGGITNGSPIEIGCAFKPVSTHFKPQQTVTKDGKDTSLTNTGRHDPCVLPRAVPLVEAAVWLTLMDHALRTRALGRLEDG